MNPLASFSRFFTPPAETAAVSLLVNPWFADAGCKMSKAGWLESGGAWKTSYNRPGAAKGNPGICRTAIKWHSIDSVPPYVTGKLQQTISGTFPAKLTLQYWHVSLMSGLGEVNVYARGFSGAWTRILSTYYGGHLKTWRQSPVYPFDVPPGTWEVLAEATGWHTGSGGVKLTGIELLEA